MWEGGGGAQATSCPCAVGRVRYETHRGFVEDFLLGALTQKWAGGTDLARLAILVYPGDAAADGDVRSWSAAWLTRRLRPPLPRHP